MDYKSAGVDTHGGQKFIQRVKGDIQATHNDKVIGGIGGFGALFSADFKGYEDPVLVSGTDGVGTKLELAKRWQDYSGVGIDLVAMCINDILTLGAKPLFFLDYMATGSIAGEQNEPAVRSIAKGCRWAGAALIGGETAEHPGVMQKSDLDLAGFCVGVVDRPKIIDGPSSIKPDMDLIGISASGPHSNGFSLIRKILEVKGDITDEQKAAILKPTYIYVNLVSDLIAEFGDKLAGMVHVTGGGFYENVPRVLPDGIRARIELDTWPVPGIFKELSQWGDVRQDEMFAVYNMGIGLILVCDPSVTQAIIQKVAAARASEAQLLNELSLEDIEPAAAFHIGHTVAASEPILNPRHRLNVREPEAAVEFIGHDDEE